MSPQRTIRLSQTISPFGVGAIYDTQGESLIAPDTASWSGRGRPLRLDRLADALGVAEFRAAPSKATLFGSSPQGALPFHRFPRWLFCTSCRRMHRQTRSQDESGDVPLCNCLPKQRQARLVPMRFVVACKGGHLSDVPWLAWAHSQPLNDDQRQCRADALQYRTLAGVGGGLRSLEVRCVQCAARRSLDRITAPNALRQIGQYCAGGQPWQSRRDHSRCDEDPRVEQRGSGNLYFPLVESAIDIPPDSDHDAQSDLIERVTNDSLFGAIVSGEGAIQGMLISTLARKLEVDESTVKHIADQEAARRAGTMTGSLSVAPGDGGGAGLLKAEWSAFTTPRDRFDERDRFVVRHVDSRTAAPDTAAGKAFGSVIEQIVLADRLREVRALRAFTRLSPPAEGVSEVKVDLGKGLDWLPAVEVFGEGIFISLTEAMLAKWEADAEVLAIGKSITAATSQSGVHWLPEATPRLVLLHTLAHVLIRRLSFECGYSSSSLRERIYADRGSSPMAGILIYTAAGDSEGSLGGLVRQGEPNRLLSTLLAALQGAAWCSQDPVCREIRSGRGGLNRGACHACALVSETSCVMGNLLLDRRLLVGDGHLRGLFGELLQTAWQSDGEESVPGDPVEHTT